MSDDASSISRLCAIILSEPSQTMMPRAFGFLARSFLSKRNASILAEFAHLQILLQNDTTVDELQIIYNYLSTTHGTIESAWRDNIFSQLSPRWFMLMSPTCPTIQIMRDHIGDPPTRANVYLALCGPYGMSNYFKIALEICGAHEWSLDSVNMLITVVSKYSDYTFLKKFQQHWAVVTGTVSRNVYLPKYCEIVPLIVMINRNNMGIIQNCDYSGDLTETETHRSIPPPTTAATAASPAPVDLQTMKNDTLTQGLRSISSKMRSLGVVTLLHRIEDAQLIARLEVVEELNEEALAEIRCLLTPLGFSHIEQSIVIPLALCGGDDDI